MNPMEFRRVQTAMATIGLPAPLTIEPLGPPRNHALHRLRMPAGRGDLLLRRTLWSARSDALQIELAALMAARAAPELPVARAFWILPEGTLPGTAAVTSWLPGRPASSLVDETPEGVCGAAGTALDALERVPVAGFGMSVFGGNFLPSRARWGGECVALAHELAGLSRRAGVSLGPVTDALVARVEAAEAGLDRVRSFALVHGDLSPGNLLLGDTEPHGSRRVYRLVGILDWEHACAGDPLMSWGRALELEPPGLGAVLTGYGVDRVRRWDEGCFQRLDAYRALGVLRRGAEAASPELERAGGRGLAMAMASASADELLRGAGTRVRVEAALTATDPAGARLALPVPRQSRQRAALDRLLLGSAYPLDRPELLSEAIALTLAGHHVPHRPARSATVPIQPIRDTRRWARETTADVWRSVATGGGESLTLWWLGLELFGALEPLGSADDAVLRGLGARVFAAGARTTPAATPSVVARHALCALAACHRLAAFLDMPPPPGDDLRATLQVARIDVEVFGAGLGSVELPEALAQARVPQAMPALWAVHLLPDEDLPAPRGLLAALALAA